jgi:hypothetical protein
MSGIASWKQHAVSRYRDCRRPGLWCTESAHISGRAKGDILLYLTLTWAATRIEACLQAQTLGGGVLPGLVPKWHPALDALPQCCQFCFALRLIDPIQPIYAPR